MDIVKVIKNSDNVLIVGHMRPDGDCLGAGLSLLRICEKLDKKVYFVCDSELPPSYSFMQDYEKINFFEDINFDLLIAVDCGDSARMGKYKNYLKKVETTINIDHHLTNNGYAKINYIKSGKSSTCHMIFELLESGNMIDNVIAGYLYVGLSTDTGHFMHNTTSFEVFKVAAKLAELGADVSYISDKLYKNRSINKTRLIVKAIQSLKFFNNNTICFISIFLKDLKECDCDLYDTEGLIDFASGIAGVKVSACIAEQKNKIFKIGLRSKGINVANVAATFGGGGHVRASGCVISGYYEDVISKLERAVICEIDIDDERNNQSK